jgi:hypothetical protein
VIQFSNTVKTHASDSALLRQCIFSHCFCNPIIRNGRVST